MVGSIRAQTSHTVDSDVYYGMVLCHESDKILVPIFLRMYLHCASLQLRAELGGGLSPQYLESVIAN